MGYLFVKVIRQRSWEMKAEFPELGLTADLLKGKQSIRATFKLPPDIIRLLSIAASQLGIKQKTLFDQLVEDSPLPCITLP